MLIQIGIRQNIYQYFLFSEDKSEAQSRRKQRRYQKYLQSKG